MPGADAMTIGPIEAASVAGQLMELDDNKRSWMMIGLMLFILLSAVGFWLQLYAYGIGDRKVILKSRICARCDELEMDADADRTQALLPEDRVDRVRNRRSRQAVSAERIIHDVGATVHIGVHPGPVQSAPPAPTVRRRG